MKFNENNENPKKKRRKRNSNVRRSKTSQRSVKSASHSKEPMTFIAFRISSTKLPKKKQRSLALKPYHCENLPQKHVVSYAPAIARADLKVLQKYSPRLSQVDVKVIEMGIKEGKNWEAHRLGRPRRIKIPINAEKEGRENFKYLSDDHPIIVQLYKENEQARKCAEQYEITWVLVSIKPGLEMAIVSGDKGWEMRKGITTVSKIDEGAIEPYLQSTWSYTPQDLSAISSNTQIERGKKIVRYLHRVIKALHAYVVERANENNKPYYPRRDSRVIYVGHQLEQFNITLDQAFSAVPFKVSARKYKDDKWRRKRRWEWDQLMENYNPGTAEAMS